MYYSLPSLLWGKQKRNEHPISQWSTVVWTWIQRREMYCWRHKARMYMIKPELELDFLTPDYGSCQWWQLFHAEYLNQDWNWMLFQSFRFIVQVSHGHGLRWSWCWDSEHLAHCPFLFWDFNFIVDDLPNCSVSLLTSSFPMITSSTYLHHPHWWLSSVLHH